MSFRYRHGDRPLEGYTIKRGVGHGGFGEVYYAVSDGGREVALKAIFLNHEVELRGVRHCINLKSPNLISIFDVRSNDQGLPFVIMEYVSGPSLRDLLRDHPEGLGEEKAAYLLREIAKGLAYLHEHGIVHRDLKPENIFYEDGFVKIGDYGLSKYISVSRQSGQTMSVGTVHYMAPEIGSGVYSRGIDIYALGVIFYELLTGRVPFAGDSFGEILMKHLTADPDLSGIREPFRSVIERALAKKPEERYGSAEEMARELFRSESLEERVSLFNPATLSVAARRAPPAPARPAQAAFAPELEDFEGGVRTVTPPPGGPPPIPVPAGREEPPPLPREAAPKSPPKVAPEAAPGPRGAPAAAAHPAPSPAPVPSGWPTSARFNYTEATLHDPLDLAQRLGRVGFITVCAAAVGIFLLERGNGGIGLAFVALSAAASVLGSELWLADRFRISEGLPRRLVAGVLGLLPMAIGALAYRPNHGAPAAISLFCALLIIDWRERLDPNREDRISYGQAFLAGVWGLFTGLFASEPFFVGGSLAVASLLVNAFAPFVPPEVRRQKLRAEANRSRPAQGRDEIQRQGEQIQRQGEQFQRQGGPAAVPHADPAAWAGAGRAPAAGEPGYRGAGVRTAAETSHAWRRPGRSGPAALPVDPGRPPGAVAQVAWPFLGALVIAGGLSLLVLSFLDGWFREDEALCATGFGAGLVAFSLFPFYRGLWARSRTFAGRTVRPFLIALSLGGAVGTGSGLVRLPFLGRVPDDILLLLLWGFGCSVAICIFLLTVARFAVDVERQPSAHLPWRLRPVSPTARTLCLFLGLLGVASAVTVAVGAELGNVHQYDRAGFHLLTIGLLGLGILFLQQGLRRIRGTIWTGKVRPFLLIAAPTLITIGLYCLTSAPWSVHADERVAWIVAMIFAGVLGVFAAIVPGRIEGGELGRAPEASRDIASVSSPSSSASRGWSALSWISWTLGVPLVFLFVFLVTGFGGATGPSYAPEAAAGLPVLALLGFGLCIVGALSGVIARAKSPGAHLARGLLAQAAFLGSLASFCTALSELHVTDYRVIEMAQVGDFKTAFASMVVCALLGAVLGVWPQRSPRNASIAQASREDRP